MILLRRTTQVLEDREDVLALGAAHQPLVERCVLDLGFDARLTSLACARGARNATRPRVAGHGDAVALEERAQGLDVASLGLDDVDERALGPEVVNDLVVDRPRPVLVVERLVERADLSLRESRHGFSPRAVAPRCGARARCARNDYSSKLRSIHAVFS